MLQIKRRITLAQKITLGFSIVLAILAGISITAEKSLRSLLSEDRKLLRDYNVITSLEVALSSVKDVETGQRGFVITGDASYLEPYQNAIITLQGVSARLEYLLQGDALQSQRFAKLREKIFTRAALAAEIIDARRSDGFDKAVMLMRLRQTKLLTDEIRRQAAVMLDRQWDTLTERNAEVARRSNWSRWIIIYGNTGAIVVVALAAMLILRDLIRRDRQANFLQQGHYRLERRLNEALANRERMSNAARSETQELRRSEQVLTRTNTRLRQVLDALDQGILGIDAQAKCNYVNRLGAELLGFTSGELLARPIHEFLDIRFPDGTQNLVSLTSNLPELVNTKKSHEELPSLLQRRDGVAIPVLCQWHPVKKSGQVPALLVLTLKPTIDNPAGSVSPKVVMPSN